jgi:hypothetical protein
LLTSQQESPYQDETMSNPNFIPINPDIYQKSPSVSGNRHLQGQSSNPSFEERFEQIRTQMDMAMAQSLFDSDNETTKQSSDLFSQTINLDVLATLTKLSGQHFQPSSALQAALSPPVHVQETLPSNTPARADNATSRVDRLARNIMAEKGPDRHTSSSIIPRGMLSGHFESREQCDAIGYDRNGGTSYGTYQISSRQGTMENFIDFLRKEIPAWAERLEQAGPANTGSTEGNMPSTWKAIANEEPGIFAELQHRFITQSHYLPALEDILQNSGLGENLFSGPLQEVLFSTAVQHGPAGAGNIFKRALEAIDSDEATDLTSKLMDQIYDIRKTQFSNSSERVKSAVENRLTQEAILAKSLLDSALT